MKRTINRLLILPTALAATLALALVAHAQDIQTPLGAPVTVSGNSGGSHASECGYLPDAPTQVIKVNQPTPLRFKLQGQGQPTLWITGPVNRCVMADNLSGGTIELPGMWEQGTYSVYVGDTNQSSHPYTLSITQEN